MRTNCVDHQDDLNTLISPMDEQRPYKEGRERQTDKLMRDTLSDRQTDGERQTQIQRWK